MLAPLPGESFMLPVQETRSDEFKQNNALHFVELQDSLKGKAVVNIGMQYGNLLTDARY